MILRILLEGMRAISRWLEKISHGHYLPNSFTGLETQYYFFLSLICRGWRRRGVMLRRYQNVISRRRGLKKVSADGAGSWRSRLVASLSVCNTLRQTKLAISFESPTAFAFGCGIKRKC
jgi:hypothetical protein